MCVFCFLLLPSGTIFVVFVFVLFRACLCLFACLLFVHVFRGYVLEVGYLTTKAATSCPPLDLPILAPAVHCRSARASHGAHALLIAVHEVVGTQHAPARARLRLAAVLVARTTSCWSVRTVERSGQATVRPPSSS